MSLQIAVLVKQVPDTTAVTTKAMKADGTLNRGALPAVFNPYDLHALELALSIRESSGGSITALSMGPPAAAEVLRQCLFRGCDRAVLLTDRAFAAADTLATSYALSLALKTLGPFDLVIGGREAIDGNTAQVGPQVAEKLGINQITYVDRVEAVADGQLSAWREIENGRELVRSALPALLTVSSAANEPRPPSVRRMLRHKHARAAAEIGDATVASQLDARGLLIETLDAGAIHADAAACGLSGSPTRVKKIESVVLRGVETRAVEPTDDGLQEMLRELIADYTFD